MAAFVRFGTSRLGFGGGSSSSSYAASWLPGSSASAGSPNPPLLETLTEVPSGASVAPEAVLHNGLLKIQKALPRKSKPLKDACVKGIALAKATQEASAVGDNSTAVSTATGTTTATATTSASSSGRVAADGGQSAREKQAANDERVVYFFNIFKDACETKHIRTTVVALEGLQKLCAEGFFSSPIIISPSPSSLATDNNTSASTGRSPSVSTTSLGTSFSADDVIAIDAADYDDMGGGGVAVVDDLDPSSTDKMSSSSSTAGVARAALLPSTGNVRPPKMLMDVFVETVCSCLSLQDDAVNLQLMLCLLTCVTNSSSRSVHGHTLLVAMKTLFHIYGDAREIQSQRTATGVLNQMTSYIIQRSDRVVTGASPSRRRPKSGNSLTGRHLHRTSDVDGGDMGVRNVKTSTGRRDDGILSARSSPLAPNSRRDLKDGFPGHSAWPNDNGEGADDDQGEDDDGGDNSHDGQVDDEIGDFGGQTLSATPPGTCEVCGADADSSDTVCTQECADAREARRKHIRTTQERRRREESKIATDGDDGCSGSVDYRRYDEDSNSRQKNDLSNNNNNNNSRGDKFRNDVDNYDDDDDRIHHPGGGCGGEVGRRNVCAAAEGDAAAQTDAGEEQGRRGRRASGRESGISVSTRGGGAAVTREQLDLLIVFQALCKLSAKSIPPGTAAEHKSVRIKRLALELLMLILQHGGPFIRTHARFIAALKNMLCIALLSNCVSHIPKIFGLSLTMFLNLLTHYKDLLRSEIGVFVDQILLRILETSNSSFEHKQRVLQVVGRLCTDAPIALELFLNYDCDVEEKDLFALTIDALSKIAQGRCTAPLIQPFQLAALRRVALEGIVGLLKSILQWVDAVAEKMANADKATAARQKARLAAAAAAAGEVSKQHAMRQTTTASPTATGGGGTVENSQAAALRDNGVSEDDEDREGARDILTAFDALTSSSVVSKGQVYHQKMVKYQLRQGIMRFNVKASDGISFLVSTGHLEETPQALARFFAEQDGLDKTQIGDYLGEDKKFNLEVMHCLVEQMNFRGMEIDTAVKKFIGGFRLPGEAQKIDRLMEAFASKYCKDNPDKFSTADVGYFLAFSLIILHTDAHSAEIKPERKMTKADFLKNNKGIDHAGDLTQEYLEMLYDRVVAEEWVLDEDVGKKERLLMNQQQEGLASAFGLASMAGSGAGRRKFELFLKETQGMVLKSTELMKRKGRQQKKEYIVVGPELVGHARFLFEVACWPLLATLAVLIENEEDETVVNLCLQGFRHAIRIAARFDLEIQRQMFVSSVAKFTFLSTLKEIKPKNVECIRLLLDIGFTEGDHLGDSWLQILQCVSGLERMQILQATFSSSSPSPPQDPIFSSSAQQRISYSSSAISTSTSASGTSYVTGGHFTPSSATTFSSSSSSSRKSHRQQPSSRPSVSDHSSTLPSSLTPRQATQHQHQQSSSTGGGWFSFGGYGGSSSSTFVPSSSDPSAAAVANPLPQLPPPTSSFPPDAAAAASSADLSFVSAAFSGFSFAAPWLYTTGASPPQTASSGATVMRKLGTDATAIVQASADSHILELLNSESLASQIDASSIDALFAKSASLSSSAIVEFVKNLCLVSKDELMNLPNPRIFSLQKLVEVADHNMERVRFVWNQIWVILRSHFAEVALHPNIRVCMYAIDSLRQLAMKFLEKDELSNYNFQLEFLKPFQVVIVHPQTSEDIKEFVVQIIANMVLTSRSRNIKSGWKAVLGILNTAATDDHIDNHVSLARRRQAFEVLEAILKIHYVIALEHFGDVVRCLMSFATVLSNIVISTKAVAYLEAAAIALTGDVSYSTAAGEAARAKPTATTSVELNRKNRIQPSSPPKAVPLPPPFARKSEDVLQAVEQRDVCQLVPDEWYVEVYKAVVKIARANHRTRLRAAQAANVDVVQQVGDINNFKVDDEEDDDDFKDGYNDEDDDDDNKIEKEVPRRGGDEERTSTAAEYRRHDDECDDLAVVVVDGEKQSRHYRHVYQPPRLGDDDDDHSKANDELPDDVDQRKNRKASAKKRNTFFLRMLSPYWFPILTGFAQLSSAPKCAPHVRSAALESLFALISRFGGPTFDRDTWQMTFRGILFPLFDDLNVHLNQQVADRKFATTTTTTTHPPSSVTITGTATTSSTGGTTLSVTGGTTTASNDFGGAGSPGGSGGAGGSGRSARRGWRGSSSSSSSGAGGGSSATTSRKGTGAVTTTDSTTTTAPTTVATTADSNNNTVADDDEVSEEDYWAAGTATSALRLLVLLVDQEFDHVAFLLTEVLQLLVSCIDGQPEPIARIGVDAFKELVLRVGCRCDNLAWLAVSSSIVELFRRSLPRELFLVGDIRSVTAPPTRHGSGDRGGSASWQTEDSPHSSSSNDIGGRHHHNDHDDVGGGERRQMVVAGIPSSSPIATRFLNEQFPHDNYDKVDGDVEDDDHRHLHSEVKVARSPVDYHHAERVPSPLERHGEENVPQLPTACPDDNDDDDDDNGKDNKKESDNMTKKTTYKEDLSAATNEDKEGESRETNASAEQLNETAMPRPSANQDEAEESHGRLAGRQQVVEENASSSSPTAPTASARHDGSRPHLDNNVDNHNIDNVDENDGMTTKTTTSYADELAEHPSSRDHAIDSSGTDSATGDINTGTGGMGTDGDDLVPEKLSTTVLRSSGESDGGEVSAEPRRRSANFSVLPPAVGGGDALVVVANDGVVCGDGDKAAAGGGGLSGVAAAAADRTAAVGSDARRKASGEEAAPRSGGDANVRPDDGNRLSVPVPGPGPSAASSSASVLITPRGTARATASATRTAGGTAETAKGSRSSGKGQLPQQSSATTATAAGDSRASGRAGESGGGSREAVVDGGADGGRTTGVETSENSSTSPILPFDSQEIVTKCVLQLLLIDFLQAAMPVVSQQIPIACVNRLLDAVQESFEFAHSFNQQIALRLRLKRRGFMTSMARLPGLVKQERSGLTLFFSMLFDIVVAPSSSTSSSSQGDVVVVRRHPHRHHQPAQSSTVADCRPPDKSPIDPTTFASHTAGKVRDAGQSLRKVAKQKGGDNDDGVGQPVCDEDYDDDDDDDKEDDGRPGRRRRLAERSAALSTRLLLACRSVIAHYVSRQKELTDFIAEDELHHHRHPGPHRHQSVLTSGADAPPPPPPPPPPSSNGSSVAAADGKAIFMQHVRSELEREVAGLTPILSNSIVTAMNRLPHSLFERWLPKFFPLLTELIAVDSKQVRIATRNLFAGKIAQFIIRPSSSSSSSPLGERRHHGAAAAGGAAHSSAAPPPRGRGTGRVGGKDNSIDHHHTSMISSSSEKD